MRHVGSPLSPEEDRTLTLVSLLTTIMRRAIFAACSVNLATPQSGWLTIRLLFFVDWLNILNRNRRFEWTRLLFPTKVASKEAKLTVSTDTLTTRRTPTFTQAAGIERVELVCGRWSNAGLNVVVPPG